MATKAPKIGDRIKHTEPSFNREHEGDVVQILAMQFAYVTDKGNTRICMFNEMWKKI